MITVATLMLENQYSASAYARTDSRFSANSNARNPAAHSAELDSGNQNFTISAPATSSAARVMAQPNQ